MWPFRRKRDEPAPVSAPRPPAQQWRLVAPIQRVVGGEILTNPVERFSGSLATWQNPSFLGSLGHGVGAAEPSGTIGELAQPAVTAPEVFTASLPELPVAVPPREQAPRRGAVTVSRAVEPVHTTAPAAPTVGQPAMEAAPQQDVSFAPPETTAPTGQVRSEQPALPVVSPPAAPVQRATLPGTDSRTPTPAVPAPAAGTPTFAEPPALASAQAVPAIAEPHSAEPAPILPPPASSTVAEPTLGEQVPSDGPEQVVPTLGEQAPPPGPELVVSTLGEQASPARPETGPELVVSRLREQAPEPVVSTLGEQAPELVVSTLGEQAPELVVPTLGEQAPPAVEPAGAPAATPASPAATAAVPLQRLASPDSPVIPGDALLPVAVTPPVQRIAPGVQPQSASGPETSGEVAPIVGMPRPPSALGLGGPIQRISGESGPIQRVPGESGLIQRIPGESGPIQRIPAEGGPSTRPLAGRGDLPVQRESGPARRLGLGAPIEPAVQRLGDDVSLVLPAPAPQAIPSEPAGSGPVEHGPLPVEAAPGGFDAALPPADGFEAVRPVATDLGTTPLEAGGAGSGSPAEAAAGPLPSDAAPAMPLLSSARPAEPSPAVQRLGLGPAFGDGGHAPHTAPILPVTPITPAVSSSATASPSPVAPSVQRMPVAPSVQRTLGDGEPGPAAGPGQELPVAVLRRGSGSDRGHGPEPVTVAPWHAAPASTPVLPVVSRLMGDRPLQSTLNGAAAAAVTQPEAHGSAPAGVPSPAELPAVPVAPWQSGDTSGRSIPAMTGSPRPVSVQTLAEPADSGLPLAAASPERARPGQRVVSNPVLQLLTTAAGPAADTPQRFDPPPLTISRQVAVTASADNPVPTVSRATEPAPAPPGGVPSSTGTDAAAGQPDELVKKLFDPLLRRLKAELRLDRERRGSLTDLRH